MSDEWTSTVVSEGASEAPVTPSNPAQVNETVQEDEAVVTETTEEVTTESAATEEEVSQREQLKNLVSREKELRAQQEANAAMQTQIEEFNNLKNSIKDNPAALLDHLGISFDDLLAAQLGIQAEQPEPKSEIEQLRDEIKAMKEAEEAKIQAKQQAEIDAAISNHKNDINTLLSTETDKYELINAAGESDLVWQVTEEYFEAYGEVLTPQQAADMVENHLVEQFKGILEKTTKFKQNPQSVSEASAEEKVEMVKEAMEAKQPVRPKSDGFTEETINPLKPNSKVTLTNSGTSSTKPKSTKIDPEASKRNAAAMIRWKD